MDIGEDVLLPVTVTNNGIKALNNVTVTLATATDVTIGTAVQSFGTINPGNSVTVDYSAHLNSLASCPETVAFTLDIDHDSGTQSEIVEISAGVDPIVETGSFNEGAEGTTLFVNELLNGSNGWTKVTTQAHTGTFSWFASDEAIFSDKTLTSPWIDIQNTSSQLSFWLRYDSEFSTGQVWDGATLFIRTEGGSWSHVQTSLPYDRAFFAGSALVGVPGWGGQQTTWRQGVASLLAYSGMKVQFQFRFISDSNTGGNGFWIDDIAVTNASWLDRLECDNLACITCFPDLTAALEAFWPGLVPDPGRAPIPFWIMFPTSTTSVNKLTGCQPSASGKAWHPDLT